MAKGRIGRYRQIILCKCPLVSTLPGQGRKKWRMENLKISRLGTCCAMCKYVVIIGRVEAFYTGVSAYRAFAGLPGKHVPVSGPEFFNFKSINGQSTSVPVQKFKPGSCQVANVKSKTNASQGAAWSMKSKDMDVKKQFRQRRAK